MIAEDAPAIAAMSEQLGYPTMPAWIRERLAFINSNPDNGFIVAERGGAVVGWIHVYGVHLLESPPRSPRSGAWSWTRGYAVMASGAL